MACREKEKLHLVLLHARESCPVARTGRRAQRPSNGSLLGALFIADGLFVASDAIAAMEPSFGAAAAGASFFIWLRLARTSSSVTLTFATSRGASAGFWTAGAAIAWRKSLLDMRAVGCTRVCGGYACCGLLCAGETARRDR